MLTIILIQQIIASELINSGMLTFVNELQSLNADESMDVTLSGIVISVNDVQPRKVPDPILVTLSGIVISCNELQ